MTEATRTGSRFAEAEDENGWETAMPGIRVLVFYRGDTVVHDRVLVRKVGAPESRQCVVATPERVGVGGEYMGGLEGLGRYLARATAGADVSFWVSDSLSRFRELLAIATLENPVFVLPWAPSGAVRLDSGVPRLRGGRRGVTQRFVVDDAEPELMPTVADRRGEFPWGSLGSGLRDRGDGRGMLVRMNVGLSAGAVVCCRRLGQATVLTHLSRKSCRSGRILCVLPRQRQQMRWMMVLPFPWCKNDDVRSRGSSGTPWQHSRRSSMTSGRRHLEPASLTRAYEPRRYVPPSLGRRCNSRVGDTEMGTDHSTSCSALRGCWRWLCSTTS